MIIFEIGDDAECTELIVGVDIWQNINRVMYYLHYLQNKEHTSDRYFSLKFV